LPQVLYDSFCKSEPAPESGRKEIADIRSPGLEFRITAGGVRSFSFRFRDPTRAGKPVARATLGNYPALGLAAAREQAAEMRKAVEAGRNPVAERKALASGAGSFGALAKRYLKEYAERHKRSHKRDERNLELHVLPHWRDKAARAIKRAAVIELVEGLVTAGTPTLANRIQALVSKVYSFGIDAAELEHNPCFRMAKRGAERVRTRVLSDDEIRLMWFGAEPAKRRRSGLALRLCLLTGARVSEVAGISRAELQRISEAGKAAWIIPGARTKNKKPHVVPLSPLALAVVLDLLDMIGPQDEYLLPTRSRTRRGPIRGNTLTQAMDYFSVRLSAGKEPSLAARTWSADPPTPHALRRTVETRMAELRIPKEIRDRCSNHIPADVGSKHYNQYDYFAEKAEAFNRWSAAVEAIVTGASGATVVPITAARR
jgi:integrase